MIPKLRTRHPLNGPAELIIETFRELDGSISSEAVFLGVDVTESDRAGFIRDWAAGRQRVQQVTATAWVPLDDPVYWRATPYEDVT